MLVASTSLLASRPTDFHFESASPQIVLRDCFHDQMEQ
jgi:hypothetical protein